MKPNRQLMTAVVMTEPIQRQIRDPNTGGTCLHLAYMGEMQYSSKPPQTRLILCDSLDSVWVGDSVYVAFHSGLKAYRHQSHISTSNEQNSSGEFYYTNGQPA